MLRSSSKHIYNILSIHIARHNILCNNIFFSNPTPYRDALHHPLVDPAPEILSNQYSLPSIDQRHATMGLHRFHEIDSREVERWTALFHFDAHDASWQISAHRGNPVVYLSDQQLEWIKWGHEAVGCDREACEYLFGLKEMARRKKRLPPYGTFGSDYNHALGRFLTIAAIYQILYLDPIQVDSVARFYNATQYQHEQIQQWIEARERNIVEGSKAYNESWNNRVSDQAAQAATTALLNMSPHAGPAQDITDVSGDQKDLRVGFIKLEGHPLWIDPPQFAIPSSPP